jgi:hypothetical protein
MNKENSTNVSKNSYELCEKDYAKLNHRKSVKCPYPNCNGLVRKIKQDSEIFTKLEAVSNIYVCNANHNHRWENYKDI